MEAMLRGATALPPNGFAALTIAFEELAGAGPIVNATGLEAPAPVLEENARIDALPTFAISDALICAVKWLRSTNCVVRSCPFQRTIVLELKWLPFTESAKAGPPAFTTSGEMDA